MNIHRSPLNNPESTWFNQAVLLLNNTEMCRTIKIAAMKLAQTVHSVCSFNHVRLRVQTSGELFCRYIGG